MFHFYQVNYNYCGYSQHSHNKISDFQCLYQLYTYIISQSYHHLTAAGSDDVPLQLLLFLADFFHMHQLLEGLLVSAYLPRYPLFSLNIRSDIIGSVDDLSFPLMVEVPLLSELADFYSLSILLFFRFSSIPLVDCP